MKRIALATAAIGAVGAAGYFAYPQEFRQYADTAAVTARTVGQKIDANPVPVYLALGTFLLTVVYHKARGKSLRKFVGNLFTGWDEEWGRYMGDAVRDFRLDLRIPPLARQDQFRNFAAPTLVFGADEDVSFPGGKLVARVKELIPHAETELVAGCKHGPPTTDEFRGWLAGRVARFLG